jgi:histone H3/H4
MSEEVLVVASKVRKFIKESGDCNTSSEAYPAMSDILRKICSKAVENAKNDKRKTVMARDVEKAAEVFDQGM